MPKLVGAINFTGTMGEISAYKMRGSDKIILRRKGGPSKDQIKNSAGFDITRRNNAEFGGRSITCKWIIQMMHPQKALADHNISGPMNALLKPVQAMDTENKFGQRSILLSKMPRLLEGFNLNRQHPFDSIIRTPVLHSFSPANHQAQISIAAMLPGINFFAPFNHPLYSFVAVLGIVPDFHYNGINYSPVGDYTGIHPAIVESAWYPASQGSPALTLNMQLAKQPPADAFSLMLSIGIRFGTLAEGGAIRQVQYAGTAKLAGMQS